MRSLKSEFILCILVYVILALVLAGVFDKQSRYDSSIFQNAAVPERSRGDRDLPAPTRRVADFDPVLSTASINAQKPADADAGLTVYAAKDMLPMNTVEKFDKDTLSEKIDGKADLYLRADFQSLQAQRFEIKSKVGEWAEIYVYDMGKPINAFAVFSQQRRADSLEMGMFAYATSESLFLTAGQYYLELTSSSTDPDIQVMLNEVARKFTEQHKPEESQDPTLKLFALFPKVNGRFPLFKYVPDNVFGCAELNKAVVGECTLENGKKAMLFASVEENPVAAQKVCSALDKMFREDLGAEKIPFDSIEGAENLWGVDEMGDVTLCFSIGKYVAGVRQAPNKETALKLAKELVAGGKVLVGNETR